MESVHSPKYNSMFNLYYSMGKLSRCQINNSLFVFLSYFPRKKGFDLSCKLSPKETICMKDQNLFSKKIKKHISKCRPLISPSMLYVNKMVR